jgi:hypothetical protein
MVTVVPMMPAMMRPVVADAARTVMGQDDATATIGVIVIGRRGIVGAVVIGPGEVPMVVAVVCEPVTAVGRAAKAMAVMVAAAP